VCVRLKSLETEMSTFPTLLWSIGIFTFTLTPGLAAERKLIVTLTLAEASMGKFIDP